MTMPTLEETMRTRVKYQWPYQVQLDIRKPNRYREIAQWLKDRDITEFRMHEHRIGEFSFRWEQDALLFALRWQ